MPSGVRPQPPSSKARVALSGTIRGHHWVSVMWLDVAHTNPITTNDLSTIATAIDTAYNTTFRTVLSSDCTLTQIDVKFYPGGGTVLEYVKTVTRTGANGASVNDAAASFVVNWIIGSLYRGGHPRTYLAGVDNTFVINGSDLNATNQAQVAAQAEAYRNALNAITSTNATTVTVGTIRFQSQDNWLSPPVFYAYTSSRVAPKLGSQRRRIRN